VRSCILGKLIDIAFNWLIGEDGSAYKGRDWYWEGQHVDPVNNKLSIGIAFIGSFNDTKPNDKALNRAKKLISCGIHQKVS